MKTTNSNDKNLSVYWLFLLAISIGTIAGLGSIVFRGMIGLVHNLSFDGKFNFMFDPNYHPTPSRWGAAIILVPVMGSFLVTWLTQKFCPEARGHGVPEVMNAIYYRDGKIRPMVAFIKAITSSISIGTGGSVGREGPIIQIGSAFGSLLGQMTKLTTRQLTVLIAAGAAGGIAATFNAPIGGLVFAIELLLVTSSAVNVAIVAAATVTATIISQMFVGITPSFFVPSLGMPLTHALSPETIALFIPFGILAGGAAALFIHSIYWFEDQFNQYIKNPYWRHATGMLLLGLMLFLFMTFTNYYYVAGVGYATIMDILRDVLTHPEFLFLLFACKLLATCLTLGSGASGGVFSPALFLGATLGAGFANLLNVMFPALHLPAPLFAVAGMAALVGGSTGAVLTAITMTFEQTRDYADILPIILSVAIAYAVRVSITNESIYTLKLYRRGQLLPKGLQAALSPSKRATHIMQKQFATIDQQHISEWTQSQKGVSTPQCAVVTHEGKITGVIRRELNYLMADVDPQKLIDLNYIIVPASMTWSNLLRNMRDRNSQVALVSSRPNSEMPGDIIGVISQHELIQSSQQLAQMTD